MRALRRERRDAWLLVAALCWSLALVSVAVHARVTTPDAIAALKRDVLLGHEIPARMTQHGVKLGGLLVFLAFLWRHRPYYRAALLTGVEPAKPWLVGLGLVVAGTALNVGLAFILALVFR